MRVIVGLGNPGKKFENTRHNTGFLVIDKFLKKLNADLDKEKFNALYTIYTYKGEKIYIVKPLTYMNCSGEAVAPLMKYYGLNVEDLVVVYDDLDLPVGKVRLRENGSSGGQKGMQSIINLLGTKDFKRIRVGIDNDKQIDTPDYVLGKVPTCDKETYDESIDKASDALMYWLDCNDFQLVMSNYNK